MPPTTSRTTGPQILYIRLLEACNARCRMCKFAGSTDAYRPDPDRLRRLVDDLHEMGTQEVRFTGGEPLLYPELPDIVAHLTERGMRSSFVTNGEHLAARAKELVDAGLTKLICSLDSPRPEVHDELRRTEGLLAAATEGMELLRTAAAAAGTDVTLIVNTIVSNRTCGHLDEFLPLLAGLGVRRWNLIPLKGVRGLYLNREQIDATHALLRTLLPAMAAAGVDANTLGPDIFGATEEQIQNSSRGRSVTYATCSVPLTVGYLDAKEGLLTACNCLPHYRGRPLTIANAWDRPFAEVWNDPVFAEERRKFAVEAPSLCHGCEPSNVRFNARVAEALTLLPSRPATAGPAAESGERARLRQVEDSLFELGVEWL
ncbi:radical SAM protein [Kitasatospora sp. NPDC058170]|uniref:radical SAM protein n=1 Tax=Kitasatospora sp. NPDC058170 TaxID=3346364 RepID=UPI0036DCEEA3